MSADPAAQRHLIAQLADDLSWLEDHARGLPEEAAQASRLRLAAALVRNVLGPHVEGQAAFPLHVAVVGGAGTGKSTVTNFLCGAAAAEANPQAGFTRHPIAYLPEGAATSWTDHAGFLGPLKRQGEPIPSDRDEDIYQVRRVARGEDAADLVVWDCPDMTAWASRGYVPRLLEVAGLADVLVHVASDERYNDAVPTQFLRLFLEAGKAVVVCLVKMREADAPAFVEHFRREVLAGDAGKVAAVVTLPHLPPEVLADPRARGSAWRRPLLEAVQAAVRPVETARRRHLEASLRFLRDGKDRLLGVARSDLAALEAWRGLVQEGQIDFDQRYRKEFLTGERFHRFDEALVKLLDLLELPGFGKVVGTTLGVLRAPFRLLKGLFQRTATRNEPPPPPERPLLLGALEGWLDLLDKEAARRKDTHPLWVHVQRGFREGKLEEQARGRFEEGFRGFQLSLVDEIDRTARGIYEDLEKHPVALNTLRGAKFAMEIAAIGGTLLLAGFSLVNVVLVPLAAAVTQQLVEVLGKHYVDNQREQARARQQALVAQHLSGPLADWLIRWPASGGSRYDRLQLILRRFDPALEELSALVGQRSG